MFGTKPGAALSRATKLRVYISFVRETAFARFESGVELSRSATRFLDAKLCKHARFSPRERDRKRNHANCYGKLFHHKSQAQAGPSNL